MVHPGLISTSDGVSTVGHVPAVATQAPRQTDAGARPHVRDLGGSPTVDGRAVRQGRVVRIDRTRADDLVLEHAPAQTLVRLLPPDVDDRSDLVPRCKLTFALTMAVPPPSAGRRGSTVDGRLRRALSLCSSTIAEVLAILTDPTVFPVAITSPPGHDGTAVISAVLLGVLGVPFGAIVDDHAARGAPHDMWELIAGVRVDHGSFDGYLDAIDMASALPYLRRELLTPAG
jgi:hypothetical protein